MPLAINDNRICSESGRSFPDMKNFTYQREDEYGPSGKSKKTGFNKMWKGDAPPDAALQKRSLVENAHDPRYRFDVDDAAADTGPDDDSESLFDDDTDTVPNDTDPSDPQYDYLRSVIE
ncbi:MAG: hypothetical protein M1828_003165 [Chrysothrix sp. TS-e1954]|nr:MAG: hypothetical protein M1828_003165 [Chrysothrix sp. TS-e1954]